MPGLEDFRWALEKRWRVEIAEGATWIAPPEYVIVRKLEAFREGAQDKHLRDIAFMLRVTSLDHEFLQAQVDRLGLQSTWDEVQSAGEQAEPGLNIE